MKKLSSIFLLSLIFLLFSSCERPDLTDDVEMAYDHACTTQGAFRCSNNILQKCDQEEWKNFQQCTEDQDCNTTTGKCDPKGDSSDSENSCTKIDGNMWSPKSSSKMEWADAVSYCNNLTACGYSDWHLPTINELRTLIQNCSGTVTGGSCGVTDSCLSFSSCWSKESCYSCSYDESGGYSKLGDTSWFWSSSVQSEVPSYRWLVLFDDGSVGNLNVESNLYVRCVR